jgi:hypothetical protein
MWKNAAKPRAETRVTQCHTAEANPATGPQGAMFPYSGDHNSKSLFCVYQVDLFVEAHPIHGHQRVVAFGKHSFHPRGFPQPVDA